MINPKKGKETVEIVEWEEDTCRVIALFLEEYKLERCTLLKNGIYHENPKDLMTVIRVASDFLKDEYPYD